MWRPFNYWKTSIMSPLSLLSIKLSIPGSLNRSLYKVSYRPHIILVILLLVLFLGSPHLSCVVVTRIGCSTPNVASPVWNRVVLSHDINAIALLMQSRSGLVFLAPVAHCWLRLKRWSTRTPRSLGCLLIDRSPTVIRGVLMGWSWEGITAEQGVVTSQSYCQHFNVLQGFWINK